MSCRDRQDIATALGPLQIDYSNLYYCTFVGFEPVAVLILLSWASFLIYLLGNTAGSYFSPTLATICEKLKVPYDVAGVTFLAIGNGAPDVFGAISSFSTEGSDVLLGIGSLLGGGVFVTTVVVGCVAVLSPCKVQGKKFLRDVLFHTLAVSYFVLVVLNGSVNLILSLLFFLLYVTYVAVVVIGKDSMDSGEVNRANGALVQMTGIQTAFWHDQRRLVEVESKKQSRSWSSAAPLGKGAMSATYTLSSSKASFPQTELSRVYPQQQQLQQVGLDDRSEGYSFLIVTEDEEGGVEDRPSRGGRNAFDQDDEEGCSVINLSGLLSSSFSNEIMEDYFSVSVDESGQDDISGDLYLNTSSSYSRSLSASLLDQSDREAPLPASSVSSSSFSQALRTTSDSSHILQDEIESSSTNSGPNAILKNLYWQQWQLRRRMKRRFLTADFWGYPWHFKLLAFFESPFTILRDLTIPTSDEQLWDKYVAVTHPLTIPLFLLYLTGFCLTCSSNVFPFYGTVPDFVSVAVLSFPLILLVYVFTHTNRPPVGRLLGGGWVIIAFIMCIAWIYSVAKELVACLTVIGQILSISPGVLGLTVLAWGNSVGDLFSNISVAKRGMSEIAISGCYAGPVFNMVIGLATSFSYMCLRSYPKPFAVKIDRSAWLSLIFLYLIQLSSVIIVSSRGYRLERSFGVYLIALYVVYSCLQLLLASV